MTSDSKPLQYLLRKKILELHHQAHSGHIGCSLSCIDILISTLILNKKNNDSFILSKGHAATALYSSLHYLGELSESDLLTFYKNGTTLAAHPVPLKHKEIPFATGSLGHGFPIGSGIAMANKLNGNNDFVYVVMSDGETNEGTTWEAAQFSSHHKLDNLIVIVDKNGLQGFGKTTEVVGLTADARKWESFGFEVESTDGHNIHDLCSLIASLRERKNEKPKVIIANTVKGKGISFMENKLEWHYLPMNNEQYYRALNDLKENYI